jgi:hypothetical protein
MNSNQLPVNEYSKFQATYINAAMNVELIEELEISLHDFIRFVQISLWTNLIIVMQKVSGR